MPQDKRFKVKEKDSPGPAAYARTQTQFGGPQIVIEKGPRSLLTSSLHKTPGVGTYDI